MALRMLASESVLVPLLRDSTTPRADSDDCWGAEPGLKVCASSLSDTVAPRSRVGSRSSDLLRSFTLGELVAEMVDVLELRKGEVVVGGVAVGSAGIGFVGRETDELIGRAPDEEGGGGGRPVSPNTPTLTLRESRLRVVTCIDLRKKKKHPLKQKSRPPKEPLRKDLVLLVLSHLFKPSTQ